MTDQRFEELLQRALDNELTGPEAADLAAELRAQPARQAEFRQQLAVWDLWAQQVAPERSADAFLAACRTRLAADRGSADFVSAVTARAQRSENRLVGAMERLRATARRLAQMTRGPVGLAWTAACAVVLAGAIWFASARPAQAMTDVRGEAVCIACILHQGHEHRPAIRVHSHSGTDLYYVSSDPAAVLRLGNYCQGPVPLVAHGRAEVRAGRRVIDIRSVEPDRAAPVAQPSADSRVLFPF